MDEPTRILVVDDEDVVAEMLVEVLRLEGYEVSSVRSASEALLRLASEPFGLLITDNSMPGMSGLDLLAEARSRWPELPVILMTAYGSIDVSIRAHELGAAGYLLKPFDDITVVSTEVREALERWARRRSFESGG